LNSACGRATLDLVAVPGVRVDEQLARILLNATARAARELSALPPLLKVHADEAIQAKLRTPVAQVIADIRLEIENPIFELCPALKAEFEGNVERFGSSS
jgi:hypothetical protein